MSDVDKYLQIKGIQPSVWGKSGWIFLNSVALVYDVSKRKYYKNFFTSLSHVLPCEDCGKNLEKALPGLDDALNSKKSLLEWLLNIRNGVKADNGLKEKITLKQMILEIFETHNSSYNYIWVFILILILILLIYMFKLFPSNKKKDNEESSST